MSTLAELLDRTHARNCLPYLGSQKNKEGSHLSVVSAINKRL